jgi:hypothetical protein
VGRDYLMGDVIRTIRIKENLNNLIKDETKNKDLRINSFFNRLLEGYMFCYSQIEELPCMVVATEIFKEIIKELPAEKLVEKAKEAGMWIPKHALANMNFNTITVEEFLNVIKKGVSQYSNWHTFKIHTSKNKYELFFAHQLGKAWSIYLSEYYKTLFKEIFNIQIQTEINPKSIKIKIPKNMD